MSRTPILYVSSVSGIGGAELSLLELVAGLDRSRYSPHLYVETEGPLVDRFRRMDVPIHWGSFPFFRKRQPHHFIKMLIRFGRTVRQNNINIIQVNCDRAIPLTVIAGRCLGIPMISFVHDFLRAWYKPSYVKYLNHMNYIIANSQSVRGKCLEAGMHPEKLRVIYESVDTKRFSQADIQARLDTRREFGFSERDLVVAIIGKITPHKGHQELVESIALVREQISNVKLWVVGDTSMTGNERFLQDLQGLVSELGLENLTTWTGFRDDVPRLMNSIDVLAVPSRSEAFGRVAAEALACEKPVVATAVGGLPEIVSNGVTGYVVPPRDVRSLTGALIRLLENSDLRIAMGKRGPGSVTKFDTWYYVARFDDIYQELSYSALRRFSLL